METCDLESDLGAEETVTELMALNPPVATKNVLHHEIVNIVPAQLIFSTVSLIKPVMSMYSISTPMKREFQIEFI